MKLDPEEAHRIAALLVLAMIIVVFNVVRAYWPVDQSPIRAPQIDRALTPSERYILGEPMELSKASGRELELLPGVGPKLAARIAEARSLDQVKGVGPKLRARLRSEISTGRQKNTKGPLHAVDFGGGFAPIESSAPRP